MPEQEPNAEQNLTELGVHEIFEMSEQELAQFKAEVEASNGMLLVAVHPFNQAVENNPLTTVGRDEAEIKEIEKRQEMLPRIFSRVLNKLNRSPMLLFDTKEIAEQSGKLLKTNSLFWVRASSIRSKPEKGSRKQLVDILKSVGVKEMIIGGSRLSIWPDADYAGLMETHQWQPEGSEEVYQINGCVAGAIVTFENDFKITLSNFTIPDRRADIKKYE